MNSPAGPRYHQEGEGKGSQKTFKNVNNILGWLMAGGSLGAWVGGIFGSVGGGMSVCAGAICGAVVGMAIGTAIGVLIAAFDNETLNEFGNMAQKLVSTTAFAGQTFDKP